MLQAPRINPPIFFRPGERQVLVRICQAKCNRQIARELGISLPTVKARVSSILDQVGARDRLQLLLWCYQHPDQVQNGIVRDGLHPPGCTCESPGCSLLRKLAA